MPLTIKDIQEYTKDKPELNVLLEGQLQSSPEQVKLAMRLTVSDFNIIEPVTGYSVETFPVDVVLLYGTLHHLCNGEAERQLRNMMTYQAQGVTTGIDSNYQLYNQLSGFYKGLYESKTQQYKRYLNTEAAWGGLHSPFITINEYKVS